MQLRITPIWVDDDTMLRAGHCGMEFRGEKRGDALGAPSVRFSVQTEAAWLNELGHSLINAGHVFDKSW
jgi:hypothetical protein